MTSAGIHTCCICIVWTRLLHISIGGGKFVVVDGEHHSSGRKGCFAIPITVPQSLCKLSLWSSQDSCPAAPKLGDLITAVPMHLQAENIGSLWRGIRLGTRCASKILIAQLPLLIWLGVSDSQPQPQSQVQALCFSGREKQMPWFQFHFPHPPIYCDCHIHTWFCF